VDPIAKDYPELTPYQFASNRPIDGIDQDGLEWAPPLRTDPKTHKLVVDGNAAVAIHTDKANLLSVAIVADVFLTKGWLTRTLIASQFAGAFEHNRGKTPEQRAAQDKRTKEALANAFIGWGSSRVINAIVNGAFVASKDVTNLFRGTTDGYPGNASLQRLGITPTSTDPAIATIFSIEAESYGKGIVYLTNSQKFNSVGMTANVLEKTELEVAVQVAPSEFVNYTTGAITTEQARGLLKEMGIELPKRITKGNISSVIEQTPRLNEKQIKTFVEKANKLIKNK
jgi:hypothetical protein